MVAARRAARRGCAAVGRSDYKGGALHVDSPTSAPPKRGTHPMTWRVACRPKHDAYFLHYTCFVIEKEP